MTAAEFILRAGRVFPSALVKTVTKNSRDASAPMLVGQIHLDEVTFMDLTRIAGEMESPDWSVLAETEPADLDDATTKVVLEFRWRA